MNERQKMCLNYALSIIENRANDLDRDIDSQMAYGVAAVLINYALEENYEVIAQFDY